MKFLIPLILPFTLLGQRFHFEETTSFTIEYAPISLVRIGNTQVSVDCDNPLESGLGLLENPISITTQELFITKSKHSTKSLLISRNSQGLFNLVAEAQPGISNTGSFAPSGPLNLNEIGQTLLVPSGGLSTGHLLGQGIPISLILHRGTNYGTLNAATYWHNIQYEFL
jgi:hypothetical protein